MNRQYIGARYVPKFYNGSNGTQWDEGVTYEPLTVVTWLGNSYTSKRPVPQGIGSPNLNPNYWALTGQFDATVGALTERVDTIENVTIPAINGRITDAEDDITNNSQGIANNANAISILSDRVDSVETAVDTLGDRVDTLGNRIDTAETDISNLGNTVSALDADVTSLGGRVDTVESHVSTLSGEVSSLDDSVTNLSDDVNELDTDLNTLEGRVGANENSIISLSGRVNTAETNITSLDGRVGTAEGNITTLQGQMTTLQGRMTTAESDIDALQAIKHYADIRNYGGVADNTTANDTALANCLAENGYCYLPKYNNMAYKFNNTITLTSYQTIIGENANLLCSATNAITIRGSHVKIKGLNITTAQGGILFDTTYTQSTDSIIEDVTTTGATSLLHDNGGNNLITTLTVRNCIAYEHRGIGVEFTKAFAFIYFDHVTIDFVGVSGVNWAGFKFSNNAGLQMDYCDAEGGYSDGSHTANIGFSFTNCQAIWLNNCMADTVDSIGFAFDTCEYVYMTTCIASLMASHGVTVSNNCANFIFNGCMVTGRNGMAGALTSANGLYFGTASYVRIVGCEFVNLTGYGVAWTRVDNGVIGDCLFANSGGGVYLPVGTSIIHDSCINIPNDTSVIAITKNTLLVNGVVA